jgi:hypothetical protein
MAQKHPRQKHPGPSRGSELLTEWRADRTPAEACAALGINEAAFYAFLAGRGSPGLKRAVRIEEATHGMVPASSWLQPPAAQALNPEAAAS